MNLPLTTTSLPSAPPLSPRPPPRPSDEASESCLASCSSLKGGRWSEQDSLRFVVFMHRYQQIFNSKHQRKSCKIFKNFAEYLGRRTASQCRSHFQKLMLKHKTIAKLKRFYRGRFGEKEYQAEVELLEEYTASNRKEIDGELGIERKEIGIQTEEEEKQNLRPRVGQADFPFLGNSDYLGLYSMMLPMLPLWRSCQCVHSS